MSCEDNNNSYFSRDNFMYTSNECISQWNEFVPSKRSEPEYSYKNSSQTVGSTNRNIENKDPVFAAMGITEEQIKKLQKEATEKTRKLNQLLLPPNKSLIKHRPLAPTPFFVSQFNPSPGFVLPPIPIVRPIPGYGAC